MNDVIKKGIQRIGLGYTMTMLDVTPWKKYSKGGVTVETEAYQTRLFDCTVLNIRAMLGVVSAEMLILSPTVKDAPCVLAGFLHSVGRDTLHMEALNTQLTPIVPAPLMEVRAAHPQPADHVSSLNWYEELKLPGCVCRSLKPSDKEAKSLFDDWLGAYLRMLEEAPDCDRDEKRQHSEALVKQFILQENDSVRQVYNMLGREQTQQILLTAFFPGKDA